jgi:hypothetical protein
MNLWTCVLAVLLSLVAATTGLAQPSPQQAAQQADQLGRSVISDIPKLEQASEQAVKDLEKIKSSPGFKAKLKDLEKKGEAARAKAGDAQRAAKKAADLAAACKTNDDHAACEKAIADAEKAIKSAEAAADEVQAARGKALADADQIDKAANTAFGDRRTQVSKAMAAAKDAGLSPQKSAGVSRLQDAENKLDEALVKQLQKGGQKDGTPQGNLSKLNDVKKAIVDEVDRAQGSAGSTSRTKGDLQFAQDKLKDCPPKAGAQAPKETPIYVNGPADGTNVCISPGQDVANAVASMGLSNARVVASTATGTVVRTETDAKTAEKAATDKNVKTCFKPEPDYCLIFTPLTKFRGHDHAAQEADHGRGPHDHDGPDPPLAWGVTPPIPAWRWAP